MSKHRLTKKDMRTDELQHALEDARDYVVSHKTGTARWAIVGAAVLAVLGAVWGGVTLRSNRLASRLSKAVAIFDAPLVTDGAPVSPGQRVFKDVAERAAEARKELRALAKDAPSSRSGRAAAVLVLALDGPAAASGATLDAVKGFARDESGSMAAGVAAVTLLESEAAAGRTKEAIEIAKRYLEAAESPLPKDVLIFTLARLYEKAGQTAEARAFYQRVVSDYPDSPMRFEAQQKATAL